MRHAERGSITHIREAAATDAEGMAVLLEELGYPARAEQVSARLARLAEGGGAAAFVAVLDERVVGLISVHLLACLHADGPVAMLTALVVSEKMRGHGIGRRLVESAERWAKHHGAERMMVTTALHRGGAHTFYERIGYEHTGRRYARTSW